MKFVRTHAAAAAMLLAPMAATLVAEPAAAQQRAVVAPSIRALTINADRGLDAGSTLQLRVQATPGARWANVTLGNSGIRIPLRETSAGNYYGSHRVARGSDIDPFDLITARAQYGSRTVAVNYSWPPAFQAGAVGAGPAPQIERFIARTRDLRPGSEVRFRLVGEPGADVRLRVPGVLTGLRMDEVRPGVYEAGYTVRRNDDLGAFERAVAIMEKNGQRVTARADTRGRGWDDDNYANDRRAPEISDLSPAHGENVRERRRTHVSARVTDEGSGIDPESIRLVLNGRDVTADTRLRDDTVHFRDELPDGRYTAELTVRDKAGNTARRAWSFGVVDVDRYGSRALPLEVTSHRDNAVIDGDGNIRITGRTAPHADVRVQVESVNALAGLLGMSQGVTDRTVRADGNGHFSVWIPRSGLPIPGTRYDVQLTATQGNQVAEESLTLVTRS
jgi:hypothetical protein